MAKKQLTQGEREHLRERYENQGGTRQVIIMLLDDLDKKDVVVDDHKAEIRKLKKKLKAKEKK